MFISAHSGLNERGCVVEELKCLNVMFIWLVMCGLEASVTVHKLPRCQLLSDSIFVAVLLVNLSYYLCREIVSAQH